MGKKKIKYINHEDIIPKQYLPTFNSHIIETFIFRIPNLSEYFIYLNDDCFCGNMITRNILLNKYKLPYLFGRKLKKKKSIIGISKL